jgi:hypothetical protein
VIAVAAAESAIVYMILMNQKNFDGRRPSMAATGLQRARALAVGLLASLSFCAQAAVMVSIDGTAYPAQLRENTELLTRAHAERSPSARHYEGELAGVDGSWIRASNIRGQWQGLVMLDGRHYVVTGAQRDSHGNVTLDAQSPSDVMAPSQCGTDVGTASAQAFAQELNTGVAAADFAALCTAKVDGVCLLPELDLPFDLLFQQTFPTTFQAQAVSLLNMVDGFYRNDMSIQFDVLSMQFLTTDLFTTTTNGEDLLTDIQTKKNAGQVPFVTNPRAILHLVTGRDLTDNMGGTSIVGISNVGTLCSLTSNVGTSQVVRTAGLPSAGLTALVIAHEIGHNFGAIHDGTSSMGITNSCAPMGNIMSASLSPTATDFSTCSVSEMTAKINSLANVNQCFEFPVDASVIARAGNPTTANANENFTLDYDVAETHASVASTTITVNGTFTTPGGTFMSATLNGNACTVAANGSTYACTTDANGGLLAVTVQAPATTTSTVGATVVVASTGGVKDIDSTNDTASQTVSTSTPPAAPTGLAATATSTEVDLAWQDNSTNETSFRIDRRTGTAAFAQIATTAANATTFADTAVTSGVTYDYRVSAVGPGGTSAPATASALVAAAASGGGGGGGGGGAFGAELAPMLLALFALRRRASQPR